jgi:hypothetical protein
VGAGLQAGLDDGKIAVGTAGIEDNGGLRPRDQVRYGAGVLRVQPGDREPALRVPEVALLAHALGDLLALGHRARRQVDVSQLAVVLRALVGDCTADTAGADDEYVPHLTPYPMRL